MPGRILLAIFLLLTTYSTSYAARSLGDLVCESTLTTGTGSLNLGGAFGQYLAFVTVVASGSTVSYNITSGDGKVETGTGTFTDSAPDTLTRTAIWSTSGAGTAISLTGTSVVCLGLISSWLQPNLGTADAPQFGSIELGAVSDTTLARSGAGNATVEGKPVLTVIGVQSLTSGAAATYTPTTGTKFTKVTCTGGGGGGGGSDGDGGDGAGAGGGQAGGTGTSWFDSTEMGATATYTIGAAANGGSGTNGTDGTVGNNTTFDPAGTGTTITANGGSAGIGTGVQANLNSVAVGGSAAGTASGADVNVTGGPGGYGSAWSNSAGSGAALSGYGGSSYWGGGGAQIYRLTGGGTAGQNGAAQGSGGSGGASADTTTGVAGGNGAAGICVVEEYGF